MEESFDAVVEYADKHAVDNRTAAYMLALDRVAAVIEKAQVSMGEERRHLWQAVFQRIHEEIIPDVMLFHMVAFARIGKRINYKPSLATTSEIELSQITFKQ